MRQYLAALRLDPVLSPILKDLAIRIGIGPVTTLVFCLESATVQAWLLGTRLDWTIIGADPKCGWLYSNKLGLLRRI
jgi:hypothetical protein